MNAKIIAFAIEAHHKVNHLYDGKPYSVHLAMVAHYAQKYIDCIPDRAHQIVMDACWLHDTIEDCRLTYNDVAEVAGTEVAGIVYAVTNEKGKNRWERANDGYYEGIRSTPWAKYVKLCDRLANVAYSCETNSRMYIMYRMENEKFIDALFLNSDRRIYKDMLSKLNSLLSL